MAFLDLLMQRRGASATPLLAVLGTRRRKPSPADPVPDLPPPPNAAIGGQAPPTRKIADRLEQRIAADFAIFAGTLVADRRRRDGQSLRRLAAHLAAEARPLHALGRFTITLALSPDAANAWLLPDDVDPANLPSGWADALFSNRLARTNGWEKDLAGIGHMLRPGGVLVADLPNGDRAVPASPPEGDGAIDGACRAAGFDLVDTRDPGCLQGRAWHRAILVRRTEG